MRPRYLPVILTFRDDACFRDGKLSCLVAVQDLKNWGCRHIEVVDCRNGNYVYDAVRGREPWRIRDSRASGKITDVDPWATRNSQGNRENPLQAKSPGT